MNQENEEDSTAQLPPADTPGVETGDGATNLIYHAIKATGGFVGYLCKVVIVAILTLHFAWTFATAIGCYFIAAEDSQLGGILGALIGAALTGVTASFLVVQILLWFGAGKLLTEAQVGTTIFNQIFDIALNRTGTAGEAFAEKGVSISEAEEILNKAAKDLTPEMPETDGTLEEFMLTVAIWIAGWMQRAVIWATVKIVVKQCRIADDEHQTIDLHLLRERLGPKIDGAIASYIRDVSVRIIYSSVALATAMALGAARLIHWLPI